MPSQIQSILFDKDKFTSTQARQWLRMHEKTPMKKVHRTENKLRYRIRDPGQFVRFRTKEVSPGISFVFGITPKK